MNFRQKLFYTILGGVLVFVGTLANNLSSRETLGLTEFGSIRCSSITIGRGSDESARIMLAAVGGWAVMKVSSGTQQIKISCKDDESLPSEDEIQPACEIVMKGGVNGEKWIDIQAGEFTDKGPVYINPNLPRSHGVYVTNSSFAGMTQAIMTVGDDVGGRFATKDKEDKPLWKSRTKWPQ